VLPDPYNIGYQEQKCLVVDKINGRHISRLTDLREALDNPKNGYHVIEFAQSDSLRSIVLAAGDSEKEATTRILKRYGIDESYHFESKEKQEK